MPDEYSTVNPYLLMAEFNPQNPGEFMKQMTIPDTTVQDLQGLMPGAGDYELPYSVVTPKIEEPDQDADKKKKNRLFSHITSEDVSNVANGIGSALNNFGRDIYGGPKGHITQGMDAAYDQLESAVGKLGPVGKVVQLGMGANKLLTGAAHVLGGGTDSMTTVDALMNSAFLGPIGWINGWGGQTTRSFTKDEQAMEVVGGSYSGSDKNIDDAVAKANKKYGLMSNGARKQAQEEINEADRQQDLINEIARNEEYRQQMQSAMTDIVGNNYAYQMNGGYDPSAMRIGEEGMKVKGDRKDRTKASDHSVVSWLSDEELYGRDMPRLVVDAVRQGPPLIRMLNEPPRLMEYVDDDGVRWIASHWLTPCGNFVIPRIADKGGKLEFLGLRDAINNAAGTNDFLVFRNPLESMRFVHDYKAWWPRYFAMFDDAATGYIRSRRNAEGLKRFMEAELGPAVAVGVEAFRKGGEVNVIPDGQLHARNHNMDIDGITKKGIPVVTEKPDGSLEQQAEIERAEIIFRYETTKKLEELRSIYESDKASDEEKEQATLDAGKLMVHEILFNTIDNTNSLL